MRALDANVWVAAFDPADRFHDDSVAVFGATAERGIPLAGPSYVVLESVCALARRLDDAGRARAAGDLMEKHLSLHFEPLTEDLLAGAERLGVDRRLRSADSLYAATAARLGCPLLSWDSEVDHSLGALSPRDWLATSSGDVTHGDHRPGAHRQGRRPGCLVRAAHVW